MRQNPALVQEGPPWESGGGEPLWKGALSTESARTESRHEPKGLKAENQWEVFMDWLR